MLQVMQTRAPTYSGIFIPLSLATTIATYLLIAVGALVRAAGAGLGCPDWPRCFGTWIPPTRVEDLPPGYDIQQFSVINTWLEYVNRLLGVTIGLLIFATLIAAWRRYRMVPQVFWPSVAAFVLVGFQGWLGGQVVKEELASHVLTAHLVVALIIVGLLLYAHLCARHMGARPPEAGSVQRRVGTIGWAVVLVALLQTVLGTKVRSALQEIEKSELPRAEWLPLGWWPDIAHRQLAVLVVAACAGLYFMTRRLIPEHRGMQRWALWALILSAAQIAVGLGLAYAAVPPPLQVLHLASASLFFGALSVFLFQAYRVHEDAA